MHTTTRQQDHQKSLVCALEKSPSQPQRDRREAEVAPDGGALAAVPAKVPEEGLGRVGRDVGVGVDLAGDDGVDVGEADVVAVEAVALVDDAEALVAGLDEGDVDALWRGKDPC